MLFYSYVHHSKLSMTADSAETMVTALIATHGAQLRRFLLSRVRNNADVPDLVQEVYLRMLRIPDHDAVRSPEAYLFTVAQHVAHQHAIRPSNVAPPAELEVMLVKLAEMPADPLSELSAEQSLHELERALQRLSPRERATFLYHRRDGLTLQEIASRFGVSRQMVKKYLAKAVIELRKQLHASE
jgi:RNA polymerase sigma factor (sigma-70 family)